MTVLGSGTRVVAAEAYVYLYPLVLMEATRQQMTTASGRPGTGTPNRFHHLRAFPSAEFRAVVRPNFDTLYSSAWVDLTGGPVVIEAPASAGRYYMLPVLDMWTDVFANPGSRTTGTDPLRIALLPPGYDGPMPADARAVSAPTPWVWVIGRVQTNGPSDYPSVNAFQDELTITGPDSRPSAIRSRVDVEGEPLRIVAALSADEFFSLGAEALAAYSPHSTDHDVLARMALIGVIPDRPFDADRFSPAERAQLEDGARDGLARIQAAVSTAGQLVNGWRMWDETVGVYGNAYLRRALIALAGLGANPPADAIYPLLLADEAGEPLNGGSRYLVHFAAGELPPVDAFWSITMYDAEGFQSANVLNRFAIGDRDDLRFNGDGSLDILIQHEDPGDDLHANWLPAPPGPLGITMRLYAPKREATSGIWKPPPVRRLGSTTTA